MTKQAFDKISAGLREASDVSAIIAERDRLRAIIAECAASLGNGAFVSAECSDDFRAKLPQEIATCVARLTRERDEARAALAAARDMAREEAATAAERAAWKHDGDDDYSQGMDRGAREQVEACAAAIRAMKGAPR